MADTEYTDMSPAVIGPRAGFVTFTARPDTGDWVARVWTTEQAFTDGWDPRAVGIGTTMADALRDASDHDRED